MKDMLDSIKVPLSWALGIVVAMIGGWMWLHTEFVQAADFAKYQQQQVVRDLDREKRQLDTRVLELTVKRDALPAQFNPVDKALLNKAEKDLVNVERTLSEARAKEREK